MRKLEHSQRRIFQQEQHTEQGHDLSDGCHFLNNQPEEEEREGSEQSEQCAPEKINKYINKCHHQELILDLQMI